MSKKVTMMIFNEKETSAYGQLTLNSLFSSYGYFKAFHDLSSGGLPPVENAGMWVWKSFGDTDPYWAFPQSGWLASDMKLKGKICFYDKNTNGLVLVVEGILRDGYETAAAFNRNGFGARKVKPESGKSPMENVFFRAFAL